MSDFLDSIYASLSPQDRANLTPEQALNSYLAITHANPMTRKGSKFDANDLNALSSGGQTFAELLAKKRADNDVFGQSKGDTAGTVTQMGAGLGAAAAGGGAVMLPVAGGALIDKYAFGHDPRRRMPYDLDKSLQDTKNLESTIPGFSTLSRDAQMKILAAAEMSGFASSPGTTKLDGSDPKSARGGQYLSAPETMASRLDRLTSETAGAAERRGQPFKQNFMTQDLDTSMTNADRERVLAFRNFVNNVMAQDRQGGATPPAASPAAPKFTDVAMNATRPAPGQFPQMNPAGVNQLPLNTSGMKPGFGDGALKAPGAQIDPGFRAPGQVTPEAIQAIKNAAQNVQAVRPAPGQGFPAGVQASRPAPGQFPTQNLDTQLEDALNGKRRYGRR